VDRALWPLDLPAALLNTQVKKKKDKRPRKPPRLKDGSVKLSYTGQSHGEEFTAHEFRLEVDRRCCNEQGEETAELPIYNTGRRHNVERSVFNLSFGSAYERKLPTVMSNNVLLGFSNNKTGDVWFINKKRLGIVCFWILPLSKGESRLSSEAYAPQIHRKVRVHKVRGSNNIPSFNSLSCPTPALPLLPQNQDGFFKPGTPHQANTGVR
jgi:hypothetical protein